MTEHPADAQVRRQALNPGESFIIQAPAGSGKTDLLIQRYLTLLAGVEKPEEIIAITFTRKAAAEMRGRILTALKRARCEPEPQPPHEQLTWELAQAVLAQGQAWQWRLEENPVRLRIQTIDALCAALTRRMPILSRFGAQPETVEDAQELYQEAARRTLAELEGEGSWSAAIERLLRHLDNDLPKLGAMLATLLGRRDQWLRHVLGGSRRGELERGLANAVEAALSAVRAAVPREAARELVALARVACGDLQAEGKESEILACLSLVELPGCQPEELPAWRGIAALLLTTEDKWRRSADTRIGFPAPGGAKDKAEKEKRKDRKARFEKLLESLAGNEALRKGLAAVRRLPPARYTETQWEVIEALLLLLQLSAAQLRLLFAECGSIDFQGIAEAAVTALGSEEEPTDLALALDYQIKHLLVDEFQDTSVTQYELLNRLTVGWEAGDGRTLFLVGDPMQSIYRFREAEVGLFQRCLRDRRLGSVALTPLRLSVNFRSQEGIVDWVNAVFPKVLPETEDIAAGAVPYTASIAFHPAEAGQAVTVHPLFSTPAPSLPLGKGEGEGGGEERGRLGRGSSEDWETEARQVVALVESARCEQGRVAILVRNRYHLSAIAPCLRQAGLRFRAIEIEPLGSLPVVQDLLTLTRALVHPADRVAWLALLRAPWCGLSLSDLYALAGDDHLSAIWDLMQQEARLARLSRDGQQRLARLRALVEVSLALRRRQPLRRLVEGTWIALGGPACLEDEGDAQNARAYFELLEKFDEGGDLADLEGLEEEANALYAAPDPGADGALEIMTMHKAKGLEFDTVIVPGLGRGGARDKPRLLLWMERPQSHSSMDLLLAPIKETGTERDPTYDFIKALEIERARCEEGRLLYVAATRAKRHLHLLGQIRVQALESEIKMHKPSGPSLLAQLWPAVGPVFQEALAECTLPSSPLPRGRVGVGVRSEEQRIWRLALGWKRPEPPASVVWTEDEILWAEEAGEDIEFQWAGETIRHIGTVVHWCLQQISLEGIEAWGSKRVLSLRSSIQTRLCSLGVAAGELSYATDQVQEAVLKTLKDARGRWLLDPRHREVRSQCRLTGLYEGKLVTICIDRTFIDNNGIRWIVGYKVSPHLGGDLSSFLDIQQARYRRQLDCYGALMGGLDPHPIRLGLYFPLQPAWREWGPENRDSFPGAGG